MTIAMHLACLLSICSLSWPSSAALATAATGDSAATTVLFSLGDTRRPDLSTPETHYTGGAHRLFVYAYADSMPPLARHLRITHDVILCASAPAQLTSDVAVGPAPAGERASHPRVLLRCWSIQVEGDDPVSAYLPDPGDPGAGCIFRLLVTKADPEPRNVEEPWSGPRILHFNGHSFSLSVPGRTSLITTERASRMGCDGQGLTIGPAARSIGKIASVFPVGGRPQELTYVAADARPGGTRRLLDDDIERTLAEYRRTTPELKTLRLDTATTGDRREAPVVILQLTPGASADYEAVAFIGEDSVVVRIGCWVAERDGGWQHALEYVRALVGTYSKATDGKE